jgi:pectate disaccharide-lyase
MNFSSNVLPDKIGVNDVTLGGKNSPQDAVDLSNPSRLKAGAGK